MRNLIILSGEEKKDIFEKLKEQFGIENVKGILVRKGAERIFIVQGNNPFEYIKDIDEITYIERAGVYLGKDLFGQMRLSIEATQMFKDEITKNIFELDDEQAITWMQGEDLQIETGKEGLFVMKYKDNFLGCGKMSKEKISNFIPKNRRLRSKAIVK